MIIALGPHDAAMIMIAAMIAPHTRYGAAASAMMIAPRGTRCDAAMLLDVAAVLIDDAASGVDR